jgi:prepilin-type processing-associated H-X9-DG protein
MLGGRLAQRWMQGIKRYESPQVLSARQKLFKPAFPARAERVTNRLCYGRERTRYHFILRIAIIGVLVALLLQTGFRSKHPGGAFCAWVDGHVSFFNETIDQAIYRGLSTCVGGEFVKESSEANSLDIPSYLKTPASMYAAK